MAAKWEKQGFEDFSCGELGNGGQNLYISAKGVLQRIYNYDVNDDGYPDLLFANSQSMGERPPIYVYNSPLSSNEYFELPSGGSYEGVMADITGDGYDDLIIACQNNGTHTDITAFIYFGSPQGLTEKYKMELPVPNATGVTVGDFNGNGKLDVAFICGKSIRVFYQNNYGIVPFEYKDIEFETSSITGVDIDNDGYSDLYFKLKDGSLGMIWGGKEGIQLENISWIYKDNTEKGLEVTTTPSRMPASRDWRVSAVNINEDQFLFRVKDDKVMFVSCDSKRNFSTSFELICTGAVGVSVGDLNGDGLDDIAVAVCTDKNLTEKSCVFWSSKNGFNTKDATCFDTVSAQSMLITDLLGDGINQLIVCQGGTSILQSTESQIFAFDKQKNAQSISKLDSGDAMRIVAGKTSDRKEKQLVVINHETGRLRGDEDIYIYLGGEEGYNPSNKIELPGWAAVQGLMYDHNDNGYVDVLISNCSENAPHLDPGSFLYLGGPKGLKKENFVTIPSIRAHGAVVGDFRKSGYLDIATGGFSNREIRIFKGGPNGYDVQSPTKIVLGPNPEEYEPIVTTKEGESLDKLYWSDEVQEEFGQVRWLFTADFNGDGWLDLFVSQITGPYCYILWGGPEGFSTSNMTKLAADGVGNANAADLDGDGYLDLVLCGHMSTKKKVVNESYVTIYWGGPDGFKESRKTQLPVTCANACTIADFNGDGVLDIYASSYSNGRLRDLDSYLYYGEKGGVYSINNRKRIFNHSGSGCLAGDFNGDGHVDLAVACHKGYGDHKYKSFIFWGSEGGISEERKTALSTVGPHGMCSVDIGNIMDRSDIEYYYSEKFKVPEEKNG